MMATVEELESRMRFVESTIAGEKEVTLAVLQQAVRNGAVLNTLRADVPAISTRVDQLAADAAVANAALRDHSTKLAVLQQDVAAIRNDVTALRRGQEELHTRLDQVQTDMAARLEAMERNIAAILAAVTPRGPAP